MRKGKLLLFIIGVLFANLLFAGETMLPVRGAAASSTSTRSTSGRRDHEFNCLAGFRLHLRPGCKHFIAHGLEAPPRKPSKQEPAVDVFAELRQGRNGYAAAGSNDAEHNYGYFHLLERLYSSRLLKSSPYLFSSSEFHGFLFRLTPF